MKKVIYVTTKHDFWIKVAINAQERYGFDPICWITTDQNSKIVTDNFDKCLSYNSLDLGRGIPPTPFIHASIAPIDEEILESFAQSEHIAIEMMDRLDMANSFSIWERKRLFIKILSIWLSFFKSEKPELVFFVTPPHLPGEYILYTVCKYLKVETKILLPTHLGEYSIIIDSLNKIPDSINDAYIKNLDVNEFKVNGNIENDILNVVSETSPWYVSSVKEHTDRKKRFMELAIKTLKETNGIVPTLNLDPEADSVMRIKNITERHKTWIRRPYKKPNEAIELSTLTVGEFQMYLRWSCFDKFLLKEKYESLVSNNETFEGNYIFMALHYQPERTTSPDGGRYNNQYLVASMLAEALPAGWKLLIKEHPNQFAYGHTGNQSRTILFYEDLDSLPNTHLIPLDVSSSCVLRKAKAVATITGFVGWEAVCRGKPALIFGNAWYQFCKQVYRVYSNYDLHQAIDKIQLLNSIDNSDSIKNARAYAKAIMDLGVQHFTLTDESRMKMLSSNIPDENNLVTSLVDKVFN
jgi:capsular polysaccharide biosynthesis protein